MPNSFGSRVKAAWNAFTNRDPTEPIYKDSDTNITYIRPDRPIFTGGNERTIVTSIYNRFAVDASAVSIQHVRLDEQKRYKSTIESGLNTCLTLDANLDQTGRAMLQDFYMSLFDEGSAVLLPIETDDENPFDSSHFDILSMRVGRIVEWRPKEIKADVYNEWTGKHKEIYFAKNACAIVQNPFYAVMNERNSVGQRLIQKLALLDIVDQQSSSGKLDLIVQVPYTVRNDLQKQRAETRRKDIEVQLTSSKYGIAYADATEKIIQLNRSLENNLLKEVESLTETLYGQLGITKAILDGSAKEEEQLNYQNRIIEPVVSALVDEMKRKFLSKTARTQGQSIMFFKDPFRLVPVGQIADIADKFTRNEVLSSNEVRQIVGFKPVPDAKADELRNKNLNETEGQMFANTEESAAGGQDQGEYERQMAVVDDFDAQLDQLEEEANA